MVKQLSIGSRPALGILLIPALVACILVAPPASAASAPTPSQPEWNPSADYVPELPDFPREGVDPDATAVKLPPIADAAEPPAADSPEGVARAEMLSQLTDESRLARERLIPTPVLGTRTTTDLEIVEPDAQEVQPVEPALPAEGDETPTIAPAFKFASEPTDPGPACSSPGGQYAMSIWGELKEISPVRANSPGQYQFRLSNHGTSDWIDGSYLGYRLANEAGTDIPGSYYFSPLSGGSLSHGTWRDQTVTVNALSPGTWYLSWTVFVPGVGWISDLGACRSNTRITVFNQAPDITGQSPAMGGTTATNVPTLIATASDPDAWPSALSFSFLICTSPALTSGCISSPATDGSWQIPSPGLNWGSTYYWKVAVSDGAATTDSLIRGVNFFTVVAPGVDDWRQVGNGLGVQTFHGVVLPYGVFIHNTRDAVVQGANTDLVVDRTYSSGAVSVEGAFGRGWLSVFDANVVRTGPTSNVQVTYPDGRQEVFGLNSDGTYSARADLGTTNRLQIAPSGQMIVTQSSGETVVFDQAGQILRILFPDSSWEFGRSGGQVTSVTQMPSGRSINVTWSAPGSSCVAAPASTRAHVGSISVNMGSGVPASTWTYSYDCSRLTSVTAPDGGVTRYSTSATAFSGTTAAGREIPGLLSLGSWAAVGNHLERKVTVSEPGSAPRVVTLYNVKPDYKDDYLNTYNSLGGITARVCEVRTVANNTESCSASPVTYRFDEANRLRSKAFQEPTQPLAQTLSRVWLYNVTDGTLSAFFDENFNSVAFNYTDGVQTSSSVFRDSSTLIGSQTFISYVGIGLDRSPRVSGLGVYPVQNSNTKSDMFGYDSVGRLTQRVGPTTPAAPNGEISTYAYSTPDTDAIDSTGAVVSGYHPPIGLLTTAEVSGGTTNYRYAANGDLTGITDPSNASTTYSYNPQGLVVRTATNDSGTFAATVYSRDAMGRVIAERDPCATNVITGQRTALTVDYTYDLDGLLVKEAQRAIDCTTSALVEPERITQTEYDSRGRVAAIVNPLSGRTTWRYSSANPDQVVWQQDARARITTFEYSSRVNKVTVVNALSGISIPTPMKTIATYQYDNAGRLVAESNAVGRVTRYQYTGDDLPYKATVDNVLSDGTTHNVELWTRTFDGAGHITSERVGSRYSSTGTWLPNAGKTRLTNWVYDAEGRLVSRTEDPGGVNRVTTIARDDKGRTVGTSVTAGSRTESARFEVDTAGNPISITVENGIDDLTSALVRDAGERIIKSIDARGGSTSQAAYANDIAYDVLGRAIKVTGPPVLTDSPADLSEYSGLVQTSVRPQTKYGYNAFGDMTETVDPNGNLTQYQYDAAGHLIEEHGPLYTNSEGAGLQPITLYRYSSAGDLISKLSPRGESTQYFYDIAGNRIRTAITDGVGSPATTLEYYTAENQRYFVINPRGGAKAVSYDLLGRIVWAADYWAESSWETDGGIVPFETYTYNDVSDVVRIVNPAGGISTADYDGLGRPTVVRPAGQINPEKFKYDLADRVLNQVNGGQVSTDHVYDLAGRETSTIVTGNDASQYISSFTYDAVGNLLSRTNPLGATTVQTYDAANRLTSMSEPITNTSSMTTRIGYDAAGNRVRVRNGLHVETWSSYNTWGLVERIVEPATSQHPSISDRSWIYTYGLGNVTAKETKPGGIFIDREFTSSGLLSKETATMPGTSISNSRQFTYNNAGDLTSASNAAGTQNFVWGSQGRLLESSGPSGGSSAEYDDFGRLSRLTVNNRLAYGPTASYTQYRYDSANRVDMETATSSGDPYVSETLEFAYDNAGKLASRTNWESKTKTSLNYDSLGRLAKETTKDSAGTLIQQSQYGYNAGDQITSRISTGGVAENSIYSYDLAGRITSWQSQAGSSTIPPPTTYTWDKANNRLSQSNGTSTTSWIYDQRNRVQNISKTVDSTTTNKAVLSTARGSISSIGIGESSARTFQFDAFDELLSDGTHTYSYDALGRLAQRDGTRFDYIFLDDRPARAPSGTVIETASRYPNGTIAATQLGSGPYRVQLSNTHGDSTGALTRTGAQIYGANSFDPFGAPLSGSANLDPNRSTIDKSSTFGFQGSWTDPSSGLVNMGTRWYDPSIGIFLSRDSITRPLTGSASLNMYGYADGDPINNNDPDGRYTTSNAPPIAPPNPGVQWTEGIDEKIREWSGTYGTKVEQEAAEHAAIRIGGRLLLGVAIAPTGIGLFVDAMSLGSLLAEVLPPPGEVSREGIPSTTYDPVWLRSQMNKIATEGSSANRPTQGCYYDEGCLPVTTTQVWKVTHKVPPTSGGSTSDSSPAVLDPFRPGPSIVSGQNTGSVTAGTTNGYGSSCGLGGGTVASCLTTSPRAPQSCGGLLSTAGLCTVSEPVAGPARGTRENTRVQNSGYNALFEPSIVLPPMPSTDSRGGGSGFDDKGRVALDECIPDDSNLWTKGKPGDSVRNALKHYTDHGGDFSDVSNALEYVRAAREFLANPPDGTLTGVRSNNGDVVRYNPESNTFGIMDCGGTPRTFYKPDLDSHRFATNLDYFYGQF